MFDMFLIVLEMIAICFVFIIFFGFLNHMGVFKIVSCYDFSDLKHVIFRHDNSTICMNSCDMDIFEKKVLNFKPDNKRDAVPIETIFVVASVFYFLKKQLDYSQDDKNLVDFTNNPHSVVVFNNFMLWLASLIRDKRDRDAIEKKQDLEKLLARSMGTV